MSQLTRTADSLNHRNSVFCEYYNSWTHPRSYGSMLRTTTHKICVYHGIDEGELYDLDSDPCEFENLWDSPSHQRLKQQMLKAAFDAKCVSQWDPATSSVRSVLMTQSHRVTERPRTFQKAVEQTCFCVKRSYDQLKICVEFIHSLKSNPPCRVTTFYRSLRGLATLLTVLLVLDMVLSLISIGSTFYGDSVIE